MKNPKTFGLFAFIAGNALFGITSPLTKYIFRSIPVDIYLFPRYFLPGLIVYFLARRYAREFNRLSTRQYLHIFGLGLLNVGLNNLFYYLALDRMPAIYSMLSYLLMPAVIYLLSIRLLKEKLTALVAVGIGICFGGTLLLVLGSHASGDVVSFSYVGLALLLASIIAGAYGTVLSKPTLQSVPTSQFIGLQLLFGSVIFIPQFVIGNFSFDWTNAGTSHLLTFAILTLIITPISYSAYFWGVKKVSISGSASLIYIAPLAGIIGSIVLLGERFTPLYGLSIAIVMVGIWVGRSSFYRLWIYLNRAIKLNFIDVALGSLKRVISERLAGSKSDR